MVNLDGELLEALPQFKKLVDAPISRMKGREPEIE